MALPDAAEVTTARRQRILEIIAVALLPLLALPAAWHLLTEGLPQASADGLLHLFRLALLDKHVHDAMLYPRWTPDLVLGHGYPLFNFYGPAAYYLALAFRLLGFGIPAALAAAFVALIAAGGVGMYLLARDTLRTQRPYAPLVAAVSYMYAPYLLTNVYIRGAVAEVAAQALLPWVFWSTGRLITPGQRRMLYLILLALSLAGVAVAHNITLLFLPLAWLPYAVVLWWTGGRERAGLGWLAGAVTAGIGLSAVFTIPLALERNHLASTAYEVSARYLPENVWTWANFFDLHPTFEYTFAIPFQLGLVQLGLAILGLILARRKDAAWLCWIGLALVCTLAMSAAALPIWLDSSLLLIAQFPWRLLSFISLPLALFAGAAVAPMKKPLAAGVLAAALVALVIWANMPRIAGMFGWEGREAPGVVAGIAQFESDTGALGTSSSSEFMPRWVESMSPGAVAPLPGAPVVTSVESANDFGLVLRIEGDQAGPVRLMTSYFPGWVAEDGAGHPLAVSPTTTTGLLTVNAPAGSQIVRVAWSPTPIERLGSAVTLITLAVLLVIAWRGRQPALGVLLAALLAFGLLSIILRPAAQPVRQPAAPLEVPGVDWLGHRLRVASDGLWINPYWYVAATPGADFRVRWQLQSADGAPVTERVVRPFYNATSAADWPPNTVVDDAHFLQFPDGLPAGTYRLAVQVLSGGTNSEVVSVNEFTLAAPVPHGPAPTHERTDEFAGLIALTGYDAPDTTAPHSDRLDAVVRAGQSLEYTLYWRALDSLVIDYHGFLHLVDQAGHALASRDYLAGAGSTLYAPARTWGTGNLQRDAYPLRIPADAASGIYWPSVGLYDFETLKRLKVNSGAATGTNAVRLAPIKVLGQPPPEPAHSVDARFGDLARLTGYDLDLPEAGLRPGATFTVTLHFQTLAPSAADYTRFLHLYTPALGMAAQQDGPPASGANPTWAWIEGEHVADQIVITVAEGSAPGRYQLRTGFYDAQSGGARLPALDAQGTRLPDDTVILTELEVVP